MFVFILVLFVFLSFVFSELITPCYSKEIRLTRECLNSFNGKKKKKKRRNILHVHLQDGIFEKCPFQAISLFYKNTTGLSKAVVCTVLSMEMCI